MTKARPVKISSGIAVIGIYFNRNNSFPLLTRIFDMSLNNQFLVLDAVAPHLISIFFTEPRIGCHLPFDCR